MVLLIHYLLTNDECWQQTEMSVCSRWKVIDFEQQSHFKIYFKVSWIPVTLLQPCNQDPTMLPRFSSLPSGQVFLVSRGADQPQSIPIQPFSKLSTYAYALHSWRLLGVAFLSLHRCSSFHCEPGKRFFLLGSSQLTDAWATNVITKPISN